MKLPIKNLAGSLLLVMCTASMDAALAPGSETKEWPADPSKHVVKVERVINKADDAKWITAAESQPTDAEALRTHVTKQDPNQVIVDKQWWHEESLQVKIPFALTGEAVAYYSSLVEGYGKQAMVRYMQPSSHFNYNATVAEHAEYTIDEKTFQNVTVVTLKMSFVQDFAATTTESMSISKQRVVVFDKDGKALHVSGDGETLASIMSI